VGSVVLAHQLHRALKRIRRLCHGFDHSSNLLPHNLFYNIEI
jgi:hypothetical protein